MGEGLLFFGQVDATVVALDMKTGEVVWKTLIENYEHGYSITVPSGVWLELKVA
jgi:outer membrane protein assembly factor BamB